MHIKLTRIRYTQLDCVKYDNGQKFDNDVTR